MPPATRPALALLVALAALAPLRGLGHDMFLKAASFFVPEQGVLDMQLVNGTFSKSENTIGKDRLADVTVLGPAGRSAVDLAAWKAEGATSVFRVKAGAAGTYLLGVSTRPSTIPLTAKAFNEYLASDGMPDVLAARRRDGQLGRAVRERYQKHVKALVQVGQRPGDGFATPLGYPVEVVPLENPYALKPGATLRFRALVDGRPAANQLVQVGGRTADGGRIEMQGLRTDAEGIGRVALTAAGTWYVKFIDQRRLVGDAEADYASRWASLSFALR
jgi:hypothetical protein